MSAKEMVSLSRAFQERWINLTSQTQRSVELLFDRITREDGVSDRALRRFADEASSIVSLSTESIYRLAVAKMDAIFRIEDVSGATLDDLGTSLPPTFREGVDIETVYARPIIHGRYQLASGKDFQEAMRLARLRAVTLAGDDLRLASQHGSFDAIKRVRKVQYFARVPRAKACKFCLLASTKRYSTKELNPMHTHCFCDVVPIVGDGPVPTILDKELARKLKQEGVTIYRGGGKKPYQYKTSDMDISEHSELGPTLIDQNWTTEKAA